MNNENPFLTPDDIKSLTSGNLNLSKKDILNIAKNTIQNKDSLVFMMDGRITDQEGFDGVVFDIKINTEKIADVKTAIEVAITAAASAVKVALQMAEREGIDKKSVADLLYKKLNTDIKIVNPKDATDENDG